MKESLNAYLEGRAKKIWVLPDKNVGGGYFVHPSLYCGTTRLLKSIGCEIANIAMNPVAIGPAFNIMKECTRAISKFT